MEEKQRAGVGRSPELPALWVPLPASPATCSPARKLPALMLVGLYGGFPTWASLTRNSISSPSTWSPARKLSKPLCLRFLWRFYYVGIG